MLISLICRRTLVNARKILLELIREHRNDGKH